ncbi:hypothetical protein BJ944DRAFT_251742 [Cunninghamella echinulata]|nr:hypothetical protein BJ944DRAFT_251742 [Cunninghamella echinulata]
MAGKSFLYNNLLLFIYFCNIIINTNGQAGQLSGRLSPGCVLIQSKIYCFGGFTLFNLGELGPYFTGSVNEHISLDLQPLGDLLQYNQSNIQWKPVSNIYKGLSLTNLGDVATVGLTDNTYIMYGGSGTTEYENLNISHPFLHYSPQNDLWSELPLMPNNTYSSRMELVNLGDDSICVWGGTLNSSGNAYTYDYGIFNYRTKSWINMHINTGEIRVEHTATLASDGLIYIIGGYFKANETALIYLAQFNNIFTFDTKNSKWGTITASGNLPTSRGLHTTTATADGKSLLIYGGAQLLVAGATIASDIYYVFDCAARTFTHVRLPNSPSSTNNARFGHSATLYNSTSLLLLFGFYDAGSSAESLSILNVADPKNPVWATPLVSSNVTTKFNGSDGPSSNVLIPAIVVPVVVVLLGAAIGLFLFIRHRKRKQKNAFVLEQQDPRKSTDQPEYSKLFSDESTNVNTNSTGRGSIEYIKPSMEESTNVNTNSTGRGSIEYIKPSMEESGTKFVKPFQAN